MSRQQRRHRLLMIVFAVVLMGLILSGTMEFTSRSNFCMSCHEMKPFYAAWQVSRHARVACIKCHAEPGLLGYVETKVKALDEVYLHFRGTYKKPITIETETTAFSNRCRQCHKDITGKGKPHQPIHFQMEIACTSCHKGLVHDRQLNRQLPSYNVCVKCHGSEMNKQE